MACEGGLFNHYEVRHVVGKSLHYAGDNEEDRPEHDADVPEQKSPGIVEPVRERNLEFIGNQIVVPIRKENPQSIGKTCFKRKDYQQHHQPGSGRQRPVEQGWSPPGTHPESHAEVGYLEDGDDQQEQERRQHCLRPVALERSQGFVLHYPVGLHDLRSKEMSTVKLSMQK